MFVEVGQLHRGTFPSRFGTRQPNGQHSMMLATRLPAQLQQGQVFERLNQFFPARNNSGCDGPREREGLWGHRPARARRCLATMNQSSPARMTARTSVVVPLAGGAPAVGVPKFGTRGEVNPSDGKRSRGNRRSLNGALAGVLHSAGSRSSSTALSSLSERDQSTSCLPMPLTARFRGIPFQVCVCVQRLTSLSMSRTAGDWKNSLLGLIRFLLDQPLLKPALGSTASPESVGLGTGPSSGIADELRDVAAAIRRSMPGRIRRRSFSSSACSSLERPSTNPWILLAFRPRGAAGGSVAERVLTAVDLAKTFQQAANVLGSTDSDFGSMPWSLDKISLTRSSVHGGELCLAHRWARNFGRVSRGGVEFLAGR